jgi:hypothetical protein
MTAVALPLVKTGTDSRARIQRHPFQSDAQLAGTGIRASHREVVGHSARERVGRWSTMPTPAAQHQRVQLIQRPGGDPIENPAASPHDGHWLQLKRHRRPLIHLAAPSRFSGHARDVAPAAGTAVVATADGGDADIDEGEVDRPHPARTAASARGRPATAAETPRLPVLCQGN